MLSSSTISLTEPVTVWGSGFNPGEPVALLLIVDQNLQPYLGSEPGVAQATASSAGTFAVTFEEGVGSTYQAATVERATAEGPKAIRATGADGSRASVPVRIVPSGIGGMPSLFVAPVAPGGTAVIMGAGFRPGEAVTISVPGATDILVGGTANEFGAFSLEAPINLEDNLYTITARGQQGSQATAAMFVGTK